VLCIFCSGIDFVSLQSSFAVSRVYNNNNNNNNNNPGIAGCIIVNAKSDLIMVTFDHNNNNKRLANSN